jgi:hypothetical protein
MGTSYALVPFLLLGCRPLELVASLVQGYDLGLGRDEVEGVARAIYEGGGGLAC